MKDSSPWTRFKQGIGQDLQRMGHRLGPVRALVQNSWRSLSLLDELFFVVVVVVGFLIILTILTRDGFSWDTLSITALSQVPWHIGVIGIGFALTVLLLFLLWKLPKRKAASLTSSLKEQFGFENETRKTWATIVGGTAVLFTLLFTWGNLRVTQDNLRITQETAIKSQELTREGQITDGFTKAITQLGDAERLAVRLGGIYALERIAKESTKHHWPIMEVLTAYIRENAPWNEKYGSQNTIWACDRFSEPIQLTSPKPATDIQAILTVLGRRTLVHEVGWSPPRFTDAWRKYQNLDLRGTNLRNADLMGAHLEGAILRGAHLEGARLVGAQLQGADLTGAQLQGADLTGAQLQGADLSKAHLEKACLSSASLSKADLEGTHLERAELLWAHLQETNLHDVNLKGADLSGANLQNARIWRTHLEGAHLKGANLQGVLIEISHLDGADLSEAHLEGASLGSVSLKGADLGGTYLDKVFLGGSNLQGAKNLTVKQLSTVRTLYEAQLDQPLLEQIQHQYPQLLEKEKIEFTPPWEKSKE